MPSVLKMPPDLILLNLKSRKPTIVAHFIAIKDETSLVDVELPETPVTEQIIV